MWLKSLCSVAKARQGVAKARQGVAKARQSTVTAVCKSARKTNEACNAVFALSCNHDTSLNFGSYCLFFCIQRYVR